MTALRRYRSLLRSFLTRTSLAGISTRRALLWELPRVVVWRVYARFGGALYAMADRLRLSDTRVKAQLDRLVIDEGPWLYLIVVPSVLHFLVPAVRLIRNDASLIFVLNGTSRAERRALARYFPDIPTLSLRTLPGTVQPHGRVLSLLLRTSARDFGICDHDFYLFEPAVLGQLAFREGEFAISATVWRNRPTGISFPGTHLLYLRTAVLREIMQRYRIDARLYTKVPGHIAALLTGMGLSAKNPPKDYQAFFDSFQMLAALAINEGLAVRPLVLADPAWEHIGGTSIGLQVTKDARHRYLACRLLALLADPEISSIYRRHGVAPQGRAAALRAALPAVDADAIDIFLARLQSSVCGEH